MEQLIPGLYVVARGHDRFQIGAGTRSAVVPRTDDTRALLDRLAAGPVRLARRDPVAQMLREHALVTEAPVPAGLARRLAAEHPRDWQQRLAARRTNGVHVVGDLGVDPGPLLDDGGFTGPPGVALVLGRGGPDPASVDLLVRGGLPHLVVTCTDGTVTLGPFVVPGATACTACLTLHRTADDPEHPEVQRRYRQAIAADPEPPPDNVALITLALAWAVRDLTAWIDGEQPTTWSSTITLGPTGAPEVTTWLRHPECGCTWSHPWESSGAGA